MSNPTKKWERNCESPIGRCFWCKFRPKCENDDQEDNSFLFWDVLGEDCDCVYCDDCEKGDGDENKIHPPGEWRHFEFSASAASSFVFNIKFFTTVFIIIVVVSTTSCSRLPNQMISLISMFGFLCRSSIFRYPSINQSSINVYSLKQPTGFSNKWRLAEPLMENILVGTGVDVHT